MPFGKWPDFQACLTDMMSPPNNYDEETAKKTCGKLQHRLEGKEVFRVLKSKSGRRVIAQYVHVEGLDLEGDIIPNHRLKEALDDLKSRDPRFHNVNWRHTSYQIGYPLWTFTDDNGDVHKTEVDEYGLWGITEIRNDGFGMADKVWSEILTGVPMGASVAVADPKAKTMMPIKLTKDEIIKRKLPESWVGRKYWDVPLQFIEPWSLTSNPANQFVTKAEILAKDICEPCVKARAEWYIEKGICKSMNEALDRARDFYIKYAEQELQKEDDEIKLGKWYYTSSKEGRKILEKLKGESHIPDWMLIDWMMKCVEGCKNFVTDPKEFCGAFWRDGSQWYHGPIKVDLLKALLKMTWEECISEAEKDPDVKDPKALCGWLRANKQLKQTECPPDHHWDEDEETCVPDEDLTKSLKLKAEEIMQKYWKK